jgi:electron transfer flavoprotein alpha subunit
MKAENSVMVFIEQHGDHIVAVSRELLCKARRLAEELGVCVTGVALGPGAHEELNSLKAYGCARVYCVRNRRLAQFTAVPAAKAIAEMIRRHKPQIVVFGATTTGRAVAPRVASELKCGLTADCTDLQIGSDEFHGKTYRNILLQVRPAFGGNVVATIVSPECHPSMATVRAGVMPMDPPDPSLDGDVVEEVCDLQDADFPTEVIEVMERAAAVDLTAARIIVSAGMGAAAPDSLELVRELASVLGGHLGASRPVVDGGLLPKEHQVGQTGVTVRPNLYIACGISGQIQHRAGMSESKRIIAINTDPDAPIFSVAHYGIVGDLNEVIPRMIAAYKTIILEKKHA